MQDFNEILEALRDGNQEAESELFAKLRTRILAFVKPRIWNSQRPYRENLKDAEDLTADVLLVFLQKYWPGAQNSQELLGRVFAIVRNKLRQYYRRRCRQFVGLEALENEPDHFVPAPDVLYEGKEYIEMVDRSLKKMNRREQDIILALLMGNIREYFLSNGMPARLQNRHYVQIHRSRQRLRVYLGEEGYACKVGCGLDSPKRTRQLVPASC